jgi:hypothetical protein
MTSKTDIAKQASKAAYIAVINAPVKKVAGTKFQTPLTRTDIAKLAATETYKAVMAQDFNVVKPNIDFRTINDALLRTAPNFFTYLTTNEYLRNPNVPTDLAKFMNYINSPIDGKENWAIPENKEEIVKAIVSMVGSKDKSSEENFEIKSNFSTYLQSL